jgi:hypothetical protein
MAITQQRSGEALAAFAKGLLDDAAVPARLAASISSLLPQGYPGDVRSGLVEEAFVEAVSLARELEMAPGQAGRLLVLMESVLAAAQDGASIDTAAAQWGAGLAAATCAPDEDIHVQTVLFSIALRARLDSWAREIGPLHPRHWAMLERCLAAPDNRGRRPAQITVVVETPLPPLPLAEAGQQ